MKKRFSRGVSTVEMMLVSTITLMVLTGAISTFLLGTTSWVRGQGKIDVESGTQRAVRMVSNELREAIYVKVDAGGQGLTYRKPVKDETGAFVNPLAWDGIDHRIQLEGSNLVLYDAGAGSKICRNVITKDPLSLNGATNYVIFTPGAGTLTRSLTVMVASQVGTTGSQKASSRSRETIYLRNIPELFK